MNGREKAYTRFKEIYPEAAYTPDEFNRFLDDSSSVEKIYNDFSQHYQMPPIEDFRSSISATNVAQSPKDTTTLDTLKKPAPKEQTIPSEPKQTGRIYEPIKADTPAVSTAVRQENREVKEAARRAQQLQLAQATEFYNEQEKLTKELDPVHGEIASLNTLIETNPKLIEYLQTVKAYNEQPNEKLQKRIQELANDESVIAGIKDVKRTQELYNANKEKIDYHTELGKLIEKTPHEIMSAAIFNGPEGTRRLETIKKQIDAEQGKARERYKAMPETPDSPNLYLGVDYFESPEKAQAKSEVRMFDLAKKEIENAQLSAETFGRTKQVLNDVKQLIPFVGEIGSAIDNSMLMQAEAKAPEQRTEAEKVLVESIQAGQAKRKATDITKSKAMTFGEFMDASMEGALYSMPYMAEIAALQGFASPIAQGVYRFARNYMGKAAARLVSASTGQGVASMVNLPAIAKQASELARENPELAKDPSKLILSSMLLNAAGMVTEVGGYPIDKALSKLGKNFYMEMFRKAASRAGSKNAFVHAVSTFRRLGKFDGFLGENWENELDEITKSAIKATIAGEDFDYKLPFTDDEATRRLIEGAGSIALQQLGFSLPGAPAHVKSAIEDYYSSQAQPDTRMPAGEKPKFSAPEVIKPKPSKGEAAASTPKEGETAHNLTSPSPSEKGERVIGPNGEEVTLIAKSKNTATIKFDDGSVEQHPIEDIEEIPESKSEILGSQEPAVASETQGSGEAALAEQEKGDVRTGRDEKYGIDVKIEKTKDGYVISESGESAETPKEISSGGGGIYLGKDYILNEEGEFVPSKQINQNKAEKNPENRPLKPSAIDKQQILDLVGEIEFNRSQGKMDIVNNLEIQLRDTIRKTKQGGINAGEEAPVESEAKEPWQMTKAEYIAHPPAPTLSELENGGEEEPPAVTHRAEVEQALSEGKPVPEEVLKDYPELQGKNEPPYIPKGVEPPQAQEAKKPWQMTKKEYADSDYELTEIYHRNEIVSALQAGKPVPAEVLKDYPELQKPTPEARIPKRTPEKVASRIKDAVKENIIPYVMIEQKKPEGRFQYEAYNAITGEKITDSKRISGEGSITKKLSKRKDRYTDVYGAFQTFETDEQFSLDKFYEKHEKQVGESPLITEPKNKVGDIVEHLNPATKQWERVRINAVTMDGKPYTFQAVNKSDKPYGGNYQARGQEFRSLEGPATQTEQVAEAVKNEPKSIKEIAEETGILEPNVRRILGVGAKEGVFKRVERGVYIYTDAKGNESAYIEVGDSQEVLKRFVDEGKKFNSVILDPAYFSRALIGGNRKPIKYEFIYPKEFAEVMKSVSQLVDDDAHVYLMLSGAPTAQADMTKYAKAAYDAGFKAIGEGAYKKLDQSGKPIINIRGEEAAAERIILMSKSGEAREGETPIELNFRLLRPSIKKSYATQKPLELMQALITQSTLEGESVLDPFAGSGVTGVAAVETGRKPTLIEKSPETVEQHTAPNVEKALEEKKPLLDSTNPVRKYIGKNNAGEFIYEDGRGVRFKMEGSRNNIRVTEPVAIIPTKGGVVAIPPDYNHDPEFRIVGENEHDIRKSETEKPEPPTERPIVRGPKQQILGGGAAQSFARFLNNHNLQEEVMKGDPERDGDFYTKFPGHGGVEDLTIEAHDYGKDERKIIATHWYKQGGDLILDSEVVFLCDKKHGQLRLVETSTQNPKTGGEYRTTGKNADRGFAKLMINNFTSYFPKGSKTEGRLSDEQAVEEKPKDFIKEHIIVAKPAPFFKEIDILKGELPEKPKTKFQQKADEVDKEIDDLLDEFNNSFDKLAVSILPVSPEQLTLGVKIVAKMTEKGIYKFADVIARAAEKLGLDRIRQLLPALKQAYASYSATASDDVIDQLTDLKEVRNFNLTENEENVILPSDKGENPNEKPDEERNGQTDSGEPGESEPRGNGAGASDGNTTEENLDTDGTGETSGGDLQQGGGDQPSGTKRGGNGKNTQRGDGGGSGTTTDGGQTGNTPSVDEGITGQSGSIGTEYNPRHFEIDTTDEEFGKPNLNNNITALKLLFKLEKENRDATPEEKKVLVRYAGWGGLANALDPQKAERWEGLQEDSDRWMPDKDNVIKWGKKYGKQYQWLKENFTADELQSFIESTLNSHYTAADVVKSIWKIVEHLGFKGGTILEPALGIGHFFGLAPKNIINNSKLLGVEIESLSARIAKKIYPDADIQATGIEKATFGGHSVTGNPHIGVADLVVSNFPFASEDYNAYFETKGDGYGSINPSINEHALHDQFFIRNLDALRPGGLLVAITTSRTSDKPGSLSRDEMLKRGDLIGAIRLPNNAFKKNAGTMVTTDILIFRKKSYENYLGAKGFKTTELYKTVKDQEGKNFDIMLNQYFVDDPEMILGTVKLAKEMDEQGKVMDNKGGLYSANDVTVVPNNDTPLADQIAEAMQNLPEGIANEGLIKTVGNRAEADTKEGSFQIANDSLMQVINGTLEEPDFIFEVDEKTGEFVDEAGKIINPAKVDRVKDFAAKKPNWKKELSIASDYVGLRDHYLRLVEEEKNPETTDEQLVISRKQLNTLYDAFVKKHGYINGRANNFLFDDPEAPLVFSLEVENKKTTKSGQISTVFAKSDIFRQRISNPYIEPKTADSIEEAIIISMNYRNTLNPEFIGSLLNKSADDVTEELLKTGKAFVNPKNGLLEHSIPYLSGPVKTKLKEATLAAQTDKRYEKNVEELKKVIPPDIHIKDILPGLSPSSTWVPVNVTEKFIESTFGVKVTVKLSPKINTYTMQVVSGMDDVRNQNTFGIQSEIDKSVHWSAVELMHSFLNSVTPKITYKWVDDHHNERTETDDQATAIAAQRIEAFGKMYVDFVRENKELSDAVGKAYNEANNGFIKQRFYSPEWDRYPNQAEIVKGKSFKLRLHQVYAVARALAQSTLLGHFAGAGKTFTMATIAMEAKRLRMASKPTIVVQNSTLEQFSAAFKQLYPSARLLAPTSRERSARQRKRLYGKIISGNWDCIIIPKSFFDMIKDDPNRMRQYVQDKVDELTEAAYQILLETGYDKDFEQAIEKGGRGVDQRVKDLARQIKKYRNDLQKALDRHTDDTITFEQLGIDFLMVDEAHDYKKMGFHTRRDKVKGIDVNKSGIAQALDMKVRYIREKNNGRNVVFATGTPITNTLAESWTYLRYLAPELLDDQLISDFDSWSSTFVKIEDRPELNAVGNYNMTTRVRGLKNAPEFVKLFHQIADIVLEEDANIPEMPKLKDGEYTHVTLKQNPMLRRIMNGFRDELDWFSKAAAIDRFAYSHIPLTVYTNAKKAAIDIRLFDPTAKDYTSSKTNEAVKNIYDIWKNKDGKLYPKHIPATQLLFCDLHQSKEKYEFGDRVKISIPVLVKNKDGTETEEEKRYSGVVTGFGKITKIKSTRGSGNPVTFEKDGVKVKLDDGQETVVEYNDEYIWMEDSLKSRKFRLFPDIKKKLIKQGIPEDQIVIFDKQSGKARERLFEKIRSGEVRVVMGHTDKLGIGVDVQDLIIAEHHLDAPQMPYQLEQRLKRMVRQGNKFGEKGNETPIYAYFYGVEKTLDAVAFQMLINKQQLVNEVLRGSMTDRSTNDISDDMQPQLEDMMGSLAGDPRVQMKHILERRVKSLENEKADITNQASNALVEYEKISEEELPGLKAYLSNFSKGTEDIANRIAGKNIESIQIGDDVYSTILTKEESEKAKNATELEKLSAHKRAVAMAHLQNHIENIYKKGIKQFVETVDYEVSLGNISINGVSVRIRIDTSGMHTLNKAKNKGIRIPESLWHVITDADASSVTINNIEYFKSTNSPVGLEWVLDYNGKIPLYSEFNTAQGLLTTLKHQSMVAEKIERTKDDIVSMEKRLPDLKKNTELKFSKESELQSTRQQLISLTEELQMAQGARYDWQLTYEDYIQLFSQLTEEERKSEYEAWRNDVKNATRDEKDKDGKVIESSPMARMIVSGAMEMDQVKQVLESAKLSELLPAIQESVEREKIFQEDILEHTIAEMQRNETMKEFVNIVNTNQDTDIKDMRKLFDDYLSSTGKRDLTVDEYIINNLYGGNKPNDVADLVKDFVKKVRWYNDRKGEAKKSPELMRITKGQKPSDILKAREATGNQKYGMPVEEAEKLIDTVKIGLQERQGDVSRLKIEPHPESWRNEQEVTLSDEMSQAYNGKKVVWFSGFDANGFYSPETNSVWINVQATNPAQKVFSHELGHFIDINHPELYDAPFKMFVDEIKDRQELFDYYEKKYGHDNFYEALDNALKTGRKGILGEAFNDLMSERMQDVEFWKKLYAENPENTRSLIDRIREFIRNLKAKVDYQVARFLRNQERVLDAIDDMMIQFDRRMRQTETIPDFKDSMEAMLWGRRNPDKLPQLEALRKKKEFAISMAKRNYGATSFEASKAIFARQLVNEAIDFAKNPTKKTIAEEMGLTTPAFMPKEVRQQWYYSQMERVLERDLPNAGMPDIYSKTIEAYANAGKFKKEELEWSGVQDWLKKQTGKVSKQQVLDYLAQNNVQVKEVIKGAPKYKLIGTRNVKKVAEDDYQIIGDSGSILREGLHKNEIAGAIKEINVLRHEETKYSEYQLPGGENYRELLLTLPERDYVDYNTPNLRETKANFTSPHFDEPNVLAHIRFNERTIEAQGARQFDKDYQTWIDGGKKGDAPNPNDYGKDKRTLFIEEIQSDWHQKGRKEGYNDNSITVDKLKDLGFSVKKSKSNLGTQAYFVINEKEEYWRRTPNTGFDTEDEAWDAVRKIINNSNVPNAPFKTTWQEMAFRRMVRYAVENGYDKIAWTTGEQQAARYDLSKQVEDISYTQKGGLLAVIKKGEHSYTNLAENVTPEKLPDYIGKEAAKKMLEQTPNSIGNRVLMNVDLKVGGEGMKGFYDKILVDYANKFGKKYGSKVENVEIETERKATDIEADPTGILSVEDFDAVGGVPDIAVTEAVHSLPITPEMKQTLYEGLPLFQRMTTPAADDFYANLKNQTVFNDKEKRSEAVEYAIRRIQDYLRKLKVLQKEKETETGTTIPDELNAYEKETLMYRSVQEKREELINDLYEPLFKSIGAAKKLGATLDDVRRYMMALHAPERNAYLKKKNAARVQWLEQKLKKANLDPVKKAKYEKQLEFLNSGSGMSDADAAKIVQGITKRGLNDALDDVSLKFKAITRFDLDNRLEYGLISQETYDELTQMFEHYMPLRGFADGDIDETTGRTGRGMDIRGKEWKSMYGRHSEAGDILSYALLQAEEGIIRGEKNKVQRAFYDFVLNYPDISQYELEKWYFIRQIDKTTGQPLTSDDGRDIYRAQTARPTGDQYKAGLVKWGGIDDDTEVIVDFDRSRIINDKNVVGLKVDGKQVFIKLKDPKLAEALKKLNIEKVGALLNAARRVMSSMRQFMTTLSPMFAFSNFERDIQEAMLNLNAKFDAKTVAQIVASVPAAMNGLRKHLRKNYTGDWSITAREYFRQGGGTGYIESKDIDTRTRDLMKMYKEAGSNNAWILTKKGVKAVLGVVEAGNDIIENAIRLATYNHLVKDKGWSQQKALVFSKELTVNFNRKGELGNKFNLAYLFFNAQVQGITRLMQNFGSDDPRRRKRAYAQAAILAISAYGLGSLLRLIGGQDDDGEFYYDKESEWTRQHKILIPLPGEKNWLPISLPYGYNIFWAIGDNALRATTTGNAGGSTLTMLATAMDSFNPMGSNESKTFSGSVIKTISPSITDPIVDLVLNEDFMARRIRPEDTFNPNKPASEKYFRNVNPQIKAVTDALNTMTGGDKVHPGWLSFSPENIEYLIQFYTSGTGRFITNSVRAVADMAKEGKTDIRNIPMSNVVYHKTPSERADQERFYNNLEEVRGRDKEIKSLAEEKNNLKAIDIIKRYQPILDLKPILNSAEKRAGSINRKMRDTDDRAKLEALEKEKAKLFKAVNKKYKYAIDMIRDSK